MNIEIKNKHVAFLAAILLIGTTIQLASGFNSGNPRVVGHSLDELEMPDGLGFVPSGVVMSFAGENCPSGWLLTDGSELDSGTYPELFSVLSYRYGGLGSNFNLPDYRGYFLRGWDPDGTIDIDSSTRTDSAGGMTGVGSTQDDDFESHRHRLDNNRGTSGSVSGQLSSYYGGSSSIYTEYVGGSETRPVNIAVLYCIKT